MKSAYPALNRLIGKVVGARVRELRLDAELSQEELAKRAGIFRCNLSLLESGRRTPDLWTLQVIARALGVDVATIVAGINWRPIDDTAAKTVFVCRSTGRAHSRIDNDTPRQRSCVTRRSGARL